ncbi:putative transposase of IS4/5 family DUF4096 [Planktotalea frisia]|uniref:Insertion element IS402-like domain-containing protein n=1 Tax=Planktotalea frisia TaxID=696762 RepID=A0A1L9NVI2_9RHOB|nr:hypothetical protein PFRI_24310 [Planktotalea frisia]PZX27634.1 putative transposase of IS4/5 family DUF4096 [Planktotalea frisia]
MSNLYWLTEEQMRRLRPYFPRSRGRPRVDDRRVLSGIIFINRNGLRWCDAPAAYGPPKTLYNRWKRWSDIGVFARIMTGLAAEAPDNSARLRKKDRIVCSCARTHARRGLSLAASIRAYRLSEHPCLSLAFHSTSLPSVSCLSPRNHRSHGN